MIYFRVFLVEKGLAVSVKFSSLEKRTSVLNHLPLWISRNFYSVRVITKADFFILSARDLFINVPCDYDPRVYVADAFALANADSCLSALAC